MKSKMLINAVHPEECRVALVEDGVLQELEVEYSGREQTRGNIYKGVVTRIEPSIHAIFVDFGGNKHGFLPYSEIHPACYGRDSYVEGESKGEKPTIEKRMRPGQELMLQVVKEERDSKGAYLTTYISIAGRYIVIMPGSKKGGVSRKIEKDEEREKLRGLISDLAAPEGMGLIIRTAGMGRTKGELKKDLNNLLRVWNDIGKKDKVQKAPSVIYREGDIIIRSIRDYFSIDVEELLVDSPEAQKKAKDFMKVIMPRYQSRIRVHQEKTPLFSKFDLERQIESIYSNKVSLKSGGSIVIDPTEALVSIDVNSGRTRGEKGMEDTAFMTNMEAAVEIARQLRLRDLGGLIVVDFIDMRQKNHMIQVEKALKGALKRDKARIDVGRISKFGLLEMSRQRIRSSLIEKSFVPCPHCGGSGTIKSMESNITYLLRKIQESVLERNIEKVDLLLPTEIANDLLNRKREELLNIEKDYNVKVVVTGQDGIPVNSYNIEVKKRPEQDKKRPEQDKKRPEQDKKRPEQDKKRPEKTAPDESGKAAASPPKRPRGRQGGYCGKERKETGAKDAVKSDIKESVTEEKAPQKGLLSRIRSTLKGN